MPDQGLSTRLGGARVRSVGVTVFVGLLVLSACGDDDDCGGHDNSCSCDDSRCGCDDGCREQQHVDDQGPQVQ